MRGYSDTPVITGSEPLTLAQAKAQLRIDFDTEDDLINAYISAARTHCEGVLGYCLTDQNRVTSFDCFGPYLSLIGPLDTDGDGIISITYRNTEHMTTTLAASKYTTTTGRTLRVYPATDDGWPEDVATNSPGSVVVTYAAKGDVTENVKTAIKMMVTSFYENRHDAVQRYPTAAEKLLSLERESTFG